MGWQVKLVLAGVAYVVALVALIWLAGTHSGFGLVVGLVGLAAAFLAAHQVLKEVPDLARHLVVAQALMLVGIALFVGWGIAHLPGLGFAGLATLFFGLGELMASLRPGAGANHWYQFLAGGAILGACLLGLLLGVHNLADLSGFWMAALVLSVLATPIGLGLFTEGMLPNVPTGWRSAALLFGVGGALIVIGTVWLRSLGASPTYVSYFAVGAFLLVGAISSNTIADIVAVGCVGLIALANAPGQVDLSGDVLLVRQAPSHDVVVALGDSYMSGEGAKEFFTNTNEVSANTCRRAPTAYPARLDLAPVLPGAHVVFIACSGAVADQFWEQAQQPQEPIDWVDAAGDPAPTSLRPGLPQIDSYQDRTKPAGGNLDLRPRLILVGIGGNDADFGEVVQTCIAPGDCSEIGDHWLKQLPDVKDAVAKAFGQIQQAFPDTPVLVVPYSIPIRETGCSWSPFTENEHRFLDGFTRQLDKAQRAAAADAGFMYLDPVVDLFKQQKLRICDGPPDQIGVNAFARDSVNGSLEQTVDVNNWFHNSMHPNATGHGAVAQAINEWMRAHPDLRDRSIVPTERTYTAAPITAIMAGAPGWAPCEDKPAAADVETPTAAPPSERCTPGAAWIARHAQPPLENALAPILVFLVGAWLVWLRLILQYRNP